MTHRKQLQDAMSNLPKPYYESDLGVLYHGDCLFVMPKAHKMFDLTLADPSYGTNFDYFNRPKKQAKGKWAPNKNYENIDYSWNKVRSDIEIIKQILRVSKNQIVFGGQFFTDVLPPSNCWIVWDKNNTGNFGDFELAWTSFKTANRKYKWTWNGAIKEAPETRYHPNQKPVGLFALILDKYSNENDLILDPFIGSGTTAIACERLNRRWIGIEIEEKYCEIAAKRIEKERSQLKLFT